MRGIYVRLDPNNCAYVGLSCDIERRWKEENREALKPTKTHENDLYFALKYYRINKFTNKVLEEIPYDESKTIYENIEILSEREKYWIKVYDSYYNGYNKTRGGSGVTTSQEEQQKIFEERKTEILQAIEDGITEKLFTRTFKLDSTYYEVLRERSSSKADSIKYKDKHDMLNKGERIWLNKKKNRNKKARAMKDNQIGVIKWVELLVATYNLSYKMGGHARKTTFNKDVKKYGLMIENKIYCTDGHFHYVNAKSVKIINKFKYKKKPDWATDELVKKAEEFLSKGVK